MSTFSFKLPDLGEGVDPGARDFGANGGFGRVQFRIPEFDWPFLIAMFPDLNSHDKTVATAAWKKNWEENPPL